MLPATRTLVLAADLKLPDPPTPRPGERVVWYADNLPMKGVFRGYHAKGGPFITNEFNNPFTPQSIGVVRRVEPFAPLKPNWHRLPAGSQLVRPTPNEQQEFKRLLAQMTPPGPKYNELVAEIWYRGYEVFLVGGTVRDVLASKTSNDVDLVTTMPLAAASVLLKTMYRGKASFSQPNGFVRLGGAPGGKDPYVDLKMFSESAPGTADALFGSDFSADIRFRDFGCNAVYYDPVNDVLIDPCSHGISDAESRTLTLVAPPDTIPPFRRAQIAVRYFKFCQRGFAASPETHKAILEHYLPCVAAMETSMRVSYFKSQVLSKCEIHIRTQLVEEFKAQMSTLGAGDTWTRYFEPIMGDLLS